MLLEFRKNPDCVTTCRYHMPHVVVYVVPYAVPACCRAPRCCTLIPQCRRPMLKHRESPAPKSQNNSKECQIRPIHSWARSPTIEQNNQAAGFDNSWNCFVILVGRLSQLSEIRHRAVNSHRRRRCRPPTCPHHLRHHIHHHIPHVVPVYGGSTLIRQ